MHFVDLVIDYFISYDNGNESIIVWNIKYFPKYFSSLLQVFSKCFSGIEYEGTFEGTKVTFRRLASAWRAKPS